MDYRKIDAGLAVALKDVKDLGESALVVFIHTEHVPSATEIAFLEKLGVKIGPDERQVFTATLSANEVAELSDQAWVKYLKLSRKLRPLNNPAIFQFFIKYLIN
jgi:hypothetical protein